MKDGYMKFVHSGAGRVIAKTLGLPIPAKLRRKGEPSTLGPVLIGGGELSGLLQSQVASLGYQLGSTPKQKVHALVFDATSIQNPGELASLYRFFRQNIRRMASCGRAIVISRPPEDCDAPEQHIAMRALRGFIRSLGKEMRAGGTSQLIELSRGAEQNLQSTLSFCLSPVSAYVSAQTIRVNAVELAETADPKAPLAGQTVLVTGAARGIGRAIAETVASYGAMVIGVDVPPMQGELDKVCRDIGGRALPLDICADDAAALICEAARANGGLDCIVHNAGITRDKSLAAMSDAQWDLTMAVNLQAPLTINAALLEAGLINEGGRIVGVASISGIAGNKGQTNYAASKAGVIGMVERYSSVLSAQSISVNAVAPGFIETEMTAKIPFGIRQAGRRMSSLQQGGLPVDVAQTIAWLASPQSIGVTGNVVRVCGQNLLGA